MPNPQRVFLGWDRPVAELVAERLWELLGREDADALLVVVPTRHSGRRLREVLATLAAADGRALIPPRVTTPQGLLRLGVEGKGGVEVATQPRCLLAWAQVLTGADEGALRPLVRAGGVERDGRWAFGVGKMLEQTRAVAGEAGHSLAEVADAVAEWAATGVAGELAPPESEVERWRVLADLEREYVAVLSAAGLADANVAKGEAARGGGLPVGIARVVMACVPDPLKLAVQFLGNQGGLEVEAWVHAPDARAEGFDAWGVPLETYWDDPARTSAVREDQVRLVTRPVAEADAAARLVAAYGRKPAQRVALGVVDREAVPHLERALKAVRVPVYDPDGIPLTGHEIWYIVGLVIELVSGGRRFSVAKQIVRVPALVGWMQSGLAEANRRPLRMVLEAFDEFEEAHLPGTVDEGISLARAAGGQTQVVADLLGRVRALGSKVAGRDVIRLGDGLLPFLAEVFRGRTLRSGDPEDTLFLAAARELHRLVDEIDGAAGAGVPVADRLALLTLLADGCGLDGERAAGAVEALGWLELPWEDAPHLVVLGMNEGLVPESVTGDPFLPEGLRERLGLKTNGERTARDRYLLESLQAFRADGGRLDLFLAKSSDAGDPLKPSRLLFCCARADLPGRVRRLFGGAEDADGESLPAWHRAWALRPPHPVQRIDKDGELRDPWALERLGATAFGSYLRCPFRFYLNRYLRMEAVETDPVEMSPMALGILVHAVLDEFGRDPEFARCENPDRMRIFLQSELKRRVREAFGESPPLPALLQEDSALQRLAALARVQAGEAADGWEIVASEIELAETFPLVVDGVEVSGRIDRLDRHHDRGWRVIDYKTGRVGKAPEKAHLAKAREGDPAWMIAPDAKGKGGRRWTDLQLPLYVAAVDRAKGGGTPVGAAYFNLPIAMGDVGVKPWLDTGSGAGPALIDSALACAEGVVRQIRDRVFWPPSEEANASPFDEFAALFHEEVEASVDSHYFENEVLGR